ncbi:uncharacterized protein NEMAJ01_2040 [Nematocida major]|uniref:uncharacterized protein n=1 Tax=Nematocida major TaxID=1912982 RepID=UPI0020076D0C|nr:uncharacterized protein NEMAJ01_2040 [Nematocida major]KAH9387144.1 hypothetical protein NEMAJ01_2040 [Nematocida major]
MGGHVFQTKGKRHALVCAGMLLALACGAFGSVFVGQEADRDGHRKDSGLEAGLKRQAERNGVLQEREEGFGAERRENAGRVETAQEADAKLKARIKELEEALEAERAQSAERVEAGIKLGLALDVGLETLKESILADRAKVAEWMEKSKKKTAELEGRLKKQGKEFSAEKKLLRARIAWLEAERAEGKSKKGVWGW